MLYMYVSMYVCMQIYANVVCMLGEPARHIESLFQAWKLNASTRRIVLNKERQSHVMNLHKKSATYIKQKCIVLKLEMNEDPSLLKLRAGNGQVFRLALLQGLQPCKEIPKELDIVPGHHTNMFFWKKQ